MIDILFKNMNDNDITTSGARRNDPVRYASLSLWPYNASLSCSAECAAGGEKRKGDSPKLIVQAAPP